MNTNVKIIPVWDRTYEDWQDIRNAIPGLGGSDAGSVVGVNKYKSPYTVWAEKTGKAHNDFQGNDATDWGNILEPIIAKKYAEEAGDAVVAWPVIIVSNEHPFMYANIDYLIVEASEEFPAGVVTEWRSEEWPANPLAILEIKTVGIASHGNAAAWSYDRIPQSYAYQGYHYGIVLGITNIIFAALVGGEGLQVRVQQWDEEVAAGLVQAESQFWDLVELDIAPDVDGNNSTEATLSRQFPSPEPGTEFEGGQRLAMLWEELESAKEAEAAAIETRKGIRNAIVKMLGNAEYGLVNGTPICSFKASKGKDSIDTDLLKREYPDIAKAVTKTGAPIRSLREVK